MRLRQRHLVLTWWMEITTVCPALASSFKLLSVASLWKASKPEVGSSCHCTCHLFRRSVRPLHVVIGIGRAGQTHREDEGGAADELAGQGQALLLPARDAAHLKERESLIDRLSHTRFKRRVEKGRISGRFQRQIERRDRPSRPRRSCRRPCRAPFASSARPPPHTSPC